MQDFAWIRERIAAVPRVRLALTPTPLQEAPNLTRALGGPRILIKRDDLTGVAFGGNKLRNLEFRLAHAHARGAGHRHRRPRHPVQLGAADSGRLQQARPADGARAGGRRRRRWSRATCWWITCWGPRSCSRRPGPHSAGDGRRGAALPGCGRAATHPERQPDVRDRLRPRAISKPRWRSSTSLPRRADAFFMSSGGKGQAGLVLASASPIAGTTMHGRDRDTTNTTWPGAPPRSPTRPPSALGLDLRIRPRRDRQR